MGEKPGLRFIEFVIATTIGSIAGAYIARDIEFSLELLVRAVFAVAILAVFFFFVNKFASSWGKRKQKREGVEEPLPGGEEFAEEGLGAEDYPEEEN